MAIVVGGKVRETILSWLTEQLRAKSPDTQLVSVLKEAGWKSPEELKDWVRLDPAQTLPADDWSKDSELQRGWEIAQKEMLRAGWRKVVKA